MTSPIVGIDLGTTNSCLATMEGTAARVVPVEGTGIVPSVVSLDRTTGDFVVGARARNRALLDPAATVRSVKRRMGTTERIAIGDRALLPEEIAAEILRYLKIEGARLLGRPVERAVVTVPAYFADAQRRATIRAGELAGLEVVRLLNEPTAAALVYDRLLRRGGDDGDDGDDARLDAPAPGALHRVLVYDLGGGTFDVSVVELAEGVDEVRASCGDNHLGGDDFDALLAGLLRRRFAETARELPAGDLRIATRLAFAAEKAKIELSSRPYTRVVEEALHGRAHLDVEVARGELEELLEDLLAGTLQEVDRALEEAGTSAEEIERVVLVGGSTHVPRVRELLEERFACPVEHTIDPAECVALGAAIQAAILDGRVFDHILVDVAPHSLGIKTLGWHERRRGVDADQFATIVRRNSRIPVRRSEVFHTIDDEQPMVHVEVFQGESALCSENTPIGDFELPLEPCPADSPIVVDLAYDTDGIVRVEVHQKGTDNRREVTIETRRRPATPATPAREVDNYMIRKAEALAGTVADADLERRLAAAAAAYRDVLADPAASPDEVDRREDALLEALDEVEEAAAGGGA